MQQRSSYCQENTKTKQEVKKKLDESLTGEKHENNSIEDKAEKVENCEETAVFIQESEDQLHMGNVPSR